MTSSDDINSGHTTLLLIVQERLSYSMNRTDMPRIFINKKFIRGDYFLKKKKKKPTDVFTRSSFQLNLHLLMYSSSNQQVKEFIITRT